MDHGFETFGDYSFFLAVLGGVVAAIGFSIAIYKATHSAKVRLLSSRILGLERDLHEARITVDVQNNKHLLANGKLQKQLEAAASDLKALQGQCEELRAAANSPASTFETERQAFREKIDSLTSELDGLKKELANKDQNKSADPDPRNLVLAKLARVNDAQKSALKHLLGMGGMTPYQLTSNLSLAGYIWQPESAEALSEETGFLRRDQQGKYWVKDEVKGLLEEYI